MKPQIKEKKVLTFESALRLLIGRQKVLNGFESKIFPIRKQTQGKGHPLQLAQVARVAKVSDSIQLKILTPKQMLQRLTIALAQVKSGNTSKSLLNEQRKRNY